MDAYTYFYDSGIYTFHSGLQNRLIERPVTFYGNNASFAVESRHQGRNGHHRHTHCHGTYVVGTIDIFGAAFASVLDPVDSDRKDGSLRGSTLQIGSGCFFHIRMGVEFITLVAAVGK